MNFDPEKQFYSIMKMRVRVENDPLNYANALKFWRNVEEKYQERRRQWLESRGSMKEARFDDLNPRKLLLDETSQEEKSFVPESINYIAEYVPARDDEFSDVDMDMFVDPWDRYYR